MAGVRVLDKYKCNLCPHQCIFTEENRVGRCRVRGIDNPGYGNAIGFAVDPIEKKPFKNFQRGKKVLSVGPNGCNLECTFCQNWQTSQKKSTTRYVSPFDLAKLAMETSDGLAFTYTEPTLWYEYILDTAPLVKKKNGIVVMVSNGYVNPKPLKELISVTDAWNIDLKAFTNTFYRNICGGDLETVKNSIKIVADSNCHLELTWLLIPGLNDDFTQIEEASRWIKNETGEKTTLHVSRYFPMHKMNIPATPVELVKETANQFRKYLKNVYTGNI